MEKDKQNHKNRRARLKSLTTKEEAKAANTNPSLAKKDIQVDNSSIAMQDGSIRIQDKSITSCKNIKKSEKQDMTSLSSREIQNQSYSTSSIQDLNKIKSWINSMAKRIESISSLPSGFSSKEELKTKILGKLRKNIINFEHKHITNEEFMKNMQKDYEVMKKKYGFVIPNFLRTSKSIT